MKHSTQELKEIINNAPDWATHFDDFGGKPDYIHSDRFSMQLGDYDNFQNIRSLSDIKEIIELRERLGE